MPQNLPDEKVRRYLLGQLAEDEQSVLEERFISDREYLKEVEAAERDLIDEYVGGNLSAGERKHFEKLFFASERRRQKVAFARALKKSLQPRAALGEPADSRAQVGRGARSKSFFGFLHGPRPAFSFSVAAIALLFLIGAVWLVVQTTRLRGRLVQLETERQEKQQREGELQRQVAEQGKLNEDLSLRLEREQEERARAQELIAQLERERQQQQTDNQTQGGKRQPSPPVAAFLLLPGAVRGGQGPQVLSIPAGTQTVRLRLSLEDADTAQSFRAEVRRGSADGEVIWGAGVVRASQTRTGRAAALSLPARLLTPGSYSAVLLDASGNVQNIYPFSAR